VFRPDASLRQLTATREQVVAVVESINQPQISIPGRASQAVQAHLVGLRNANGSFSLYVGLHLKQSGESVVYSHERRELPVEAYRDVETEGLQFLESMGFMLDNTHFRNQASEAQEQILRRVPLFSRPRPAAGGAPGEARSGPRQALARLLAGV
jgi:hypothetical protein